MTYWEDRFALLEQVQNKTGMDTYRDIEKVLTKTQQEIDKDIEKWIYRIATNNELSMTDARRLLNSKELKEFKWDVKQYIKHGEENALSQQWMKELENASAKFHISRLEVLKLQTQQALEVAYGNQLDSIDGMMRKVYTDNYYHTAYEIQKGLHIGFDVGQINENKLNKVLNKPWTTDGKTFSDRIWIKKNQMVGDLHQQLTRQIVQGKKPDVAIKEMQKYVDSSMKNAKYYASRLVMTEQAFIASASTKDSFEALDVEMYEILATLDSKTSEVCQEMDGKVFEMKDFSIGATAPPFHVWCRTTTIPHFEDNFTGERIARGEDGKTYYVPDSMKYQDWKECFVDKTKDPADFLKVVKSIEDVPDVVEKLIQLETHMFPPSFSATKAEKENTQKLMDFVNACEGANPDVIELYSKMAKMENIESRGIEWKITHGTHSGMVKSLSSNKNGQLGKAQISYPKLTGDNFAGQVQTTLHEQMHLMDFYLREDELYYGKWFSSQQKELLDFFRNQADPTVIKPLENFNMSDKVKKLFSDFDEEYKKISDDLYKEYRKTSDELRDRYWNKHEISASEYKKLLNKAEREYKDALEYQHRNIMGGGISNLQDIYDAISGGRFRDVTYNKIRYGHGSNYYRAVGNRACESLANYGALSIARPDLIELLREDYPELVDMLGQCVKDMLEKVGD